MKSDPVIDEIRRVRHEMSAEIGHDPKRLLEYYAEIQERYRDRLVNYGVTSRPAGTNQAPSKSDGTSTAAL